MAGQQLTSFYLSLISLAMKYAGIDPAPTRQNFCNHNLSIYVILWKLYISYL